MVLVGAAIQALPPVRSLVIHIRCRARSASAPRSWRLTSMPDVPERT
jgi:hypothetical protein